MTPRAKLDDEAVERRHVAALLTFVERRADISQRHLASELGVALGLVNSYIRRCVRKGLIKVQQVPRRRYAYYLTPKGFAEKSRLTAEYLSWSLTFFRRARSECGELLDEARRLGWRRVALVGAGDLADIMILCASEKGIAVVAVVDPVAAIDPVGRTAMAVSLVAEPGMVAPAPDGWLITGIDAQQSLFEAMARQFGAGCLLHPPMLGISETVPLLVDP